MATTLVEHYTCDLDGAVVPDGQQVTRRVTVDGRSYELDACKEHAGELDGLLSRLRVVRPASSRYRSEGDRQRASAVREWARGEGLQVEDRGRIPAEVVAQYEARNG